METEIYEILENVLKSEKEASREDARQSSFLKHIDYFATYPNEKRFKARYITALKERFPSIVPDENAISYIVDRELSIAYLAEQMGKDHVDYDSVNQSLTGQIRALFSAKAELVKNIITATQIVNDQNGIDETLLETLKSNNFKGAFINPTLNYAYQSYCEISKLQHENGKQKQAITQDMSSINALIGIVQNLNNDRYHQNEDLTSLISSLKIVQAEITALSQNLQEEKAKGFFSKFFEKFRKSKYLPTVKKDSSSRVSKIITELNSAASNCENADKYEEQLEEHRTVLFTREHGEPGSKSTTSNEKNNVSLQWENVSITENTDPITVYAHENHLKLQELQKENANQQQTINTDTRDIASLLALAEQLIEKYKEPKAIIKASTIRLKIANQKIATLSSELLAEQEKSFATRLVEEIKKIGTSKSKKDESHDKESFNIVSQVIMNNLKAFTESYSSIFNNATFNQIISRLHSREHSPDETQLEESNQIDAQEL